MPQFTIKQSISKVEMLRASLQTQQHVQQLRTGSNNMLVSVRCRPLSQKQLLLSDFKTVKILDRKMVVLLDPGNEFQPEDIFRKNRNKQMQYAFDFAFDESSTNEEIYSSTTSFLIDGVVDGYNATIFAYGATGCGKTYTMVGAPDNLGVMPRCLNDLFEKVETLRLTKDVKIKISYVEIYNQNLKDLLISEDRNFEVREDPRSGIVIPGISEVPVANMLEINTLLKVGNKNRSKQATSANEASSRSHAILQVSVESQQLSGTNTEIKSSKMSLVDLAGSQRASSTSNRGLRMVEGAKINQSLLILGNCIQALSQATEKGKTNTFIPYRGSKLTRLLKDSLGGNCRTVMIANISPAVSSFEDTYNTLVYANRAKTIKTNAHRNVLNVQNHIANYTSIIQSLKRQNQDLKFLLIRNSQQNTNLPKINSVQQNVLLEKFENALKSHFEEHFSLLKQIFQLDLQMDNQGFYIFKLQLQQPENQGLSVQRIHNSRKLIETCSQKKQQLQKHIRSREQRLSDLVIEVKSSQLSVPNQSYVLGIVKQQEVDLQKQEIQYHQKKLQNQAKQKQQMISHLKQQISNRDKIIEEQKILMQKNNIISRITYSNLRNCSQIESDIKNTLPRVRERSTRKVLNERMESLDISALDTSIERVEKIKPAKEPFGQYKSLHVVTDSRRPYYNKHVQKQMKINQHRQCSVGNLQAMSPSKRKKVDYLCPEKIACSNASTKKKEKAQVHQTQAGHEMARYKEHLPNPLYMRRRKLKN